MSQVIGIFSNKGGVGKTTTAVNLAYLAAVGGAKTLLVDLDPQGSSTFYFRVKPKLKRKARGFAERGKPLDESIKGSDYPHLDLLPADFSHRELVIEFHERKRSQERLKRALKPYKEEYDYIFIDCPPTINLLAENVFHFADRLIVPLIPTTLSMHAFHQFSRFYSDSGFDLASVYPFFSMVDRRKKMHKAIIEAAAERPMPFLETIVPYLSVVEMMGITREPVPAFAPKSPAAKAFQALWNECQTQFNGAISIN